MDIWAKFDCLHFDIFPSISELLCNFTILKYSSYLTIFNILA